MNREDIEELARKKREEEKTPQKVEFSVRDFRRMMREYEKEQKEIRLMNKDKIEAITQEKKNEFIALLNSINAISKKFSINDYKFDDDEKGIHVRKISGGDFIGIINNMYFRTIRDNKKVVVETYMARKIPIKSKVGEPIEQRRMYYKSSALIENGNLKKISLNTISFVDIYDSIYTSKDSLGLKFYTKEYIELEREIIDHLYGKYDLDPTWYDQKEIIPQISGEKINNKKR